MATFTPVGGRSVKLRCDECGASGYDTNGNGWMARHDAHAPCPRCGRILTLSANGRPRRHVGCRPIETPIHAAITAVTRALNDHRRILSPRGTGATCQCGEHYDTRDEWETHQARAATDAAISVLGPPP